MSDEESKGSSQALDIRQAFIERIMFDSEYRTALDELRDLDGDLRFKRAVEIVGTKFRPRAELLKLTVKTSDPVAGFYCGVLYQDQYLPNGPVDADVLQLIERAKTDWYAYQVLRVLAHTTRRIEWMPALDEWDARDRFGAIRPPRAPRGSLPNFYRDHLIVGAIEQLEDVGFLPTRNRESPPKSAADVVNVALSKIGLSKSYEAIETVWSDRNKVSLAFSTLPSDIALKILSGTLGA